MSDYPQLKQIYDKTFDAWMAATIEAKRLAELSIWDARAEQDVLAYQQQRQIMHKLAEEHQAARQALIDAGFLPSD